MPRLGAAVAFAWDKHPGMIDPAASRTYARCLAPHARASSLVGTALEGLEGNNKGPLAPGEDATSSFGGRDGLSAARI